MATAKVKLPDLSKVGDFLKKNATPIMYIGGAILVLYLINKLIKNFRGDPSDPSTMTCNRSQTSLNEDEITMVTAGIYDAMNRIGTREQDIIDLITPLNSEDLKCVVKEFGLRRYDPLFGTGSMVLGATKSLQGWLKSELSGSSLYTVQTMFAERNIIF
jgi:hypothetical protein